MAKVKCARRFAFESLEPRNLLAAHPLITEFVASNDTTINDGFGKDSDWIEIYNAGDMAVDLQGYHLTDSATNATKWSFPEETVLGAKEYLVVFASDDDTMDPGGFWHTNFKLSAGGEYLALADPTGTILSDLGLAGNDYPSQVTDISYGLPRGGVQTLISLSDQVDVLVPQNESLGTSWTEISFNAAANGFSSIANAVGYEGSPGSADNYQSFFNAPATELDENAGITTAYVRGEFNLASASDVDALTLSLTYDDGFAVYLNGTYLFGDREPNGALAYDSSALSFRDDAEVLSGAVDFSLNDYLDLLEDGDNVLAIHALNNAGSSDMLLQTELTAFVGNTTDGVAGYLLEATPGAPNSQTFDLGPIIDQVAFSPELPGANSAIVVTADIAASEDPLDLSSPKFYYRVNFGSEIEASFADDGLEADASAGDGVFTAQIPAAAFSEGDMVRWYVTAADTDGTMSRAPRFTDPLDSAEYYGTVILDPAASDDLQVLYWFVQDEAAAETREGTRASIFYRGEFYDNIQVDLHGQSTSEEPFVKKSFDFDANVGEKFEVGDSTGRHSDFNLLTNYADQSKVRNTIAYAAHAETGNASHLAHPVSVHRNGEFYALYDFVEQGDVEWLRRLGLDTDGALYKVNNDLEDNNNGAFFEVDKITRVYEDRSDFQEVIDADDLTGSAARTWSFDNLDIAEIINYAATQNVIQNIDFGHKNMYWYRDSNDTQLWQILPWDVDLSFGHQWIGSTNPPYFDNTLFTTSLVGGSYMSDLLVGVIGNSGAGTSAVDARFTDMLKRRTLSISDQLLGLSGTAASQSWAYQQFQLWNDVTADEAIQDMNEWGIQSNFTHTPAQAVDQIQNSFIVARRNFLSGFAGTQSSVQNIAFGTVEFAPTSGNQDEEYIILTNNSTTFATDLSNWTISGTIDHTFKPGTVIPAGETLYVLADVQGFQARTTGPRGGQQLFTQGNYEGRLSNGVGSLVLSNASGAQIDTTSYIGVANNGDFDSDGDFDGQDFLSWQRGFGIATGAMPAEGDANEDGQVDQVDLSLWTSNYGSQASTLAAVTGSIATSSIASRSIASGPIASGLGEGELVSLASRSVSLPEEGSETNSSRGSVREGFFAAFEAASLRPVGSGSAAIAAVSTIESLVDLEAEDEEGSEGFEDLFDAAFAQGWV